MKEQVEDTEKRTERCRRLGEDEGGVNELYGKSNDHYYLHNNRAFMQ